MRVNFEHDFKPTTTQEIISFKYDNYDDYKRTVELLDRLPVRYMINRPIRGVFSDTNMYIDVIVPRKQHLYWTKMNDDKLSRLKLAKEYERGYQYGFRKGYRKGYHDGFDYGAETIISRNYVSNKDSKSELEWLNTTIPKTKSLIIFY